MKASMRDGGWGRRLAAAVIGMCLLTTAAHAQPDRAGGRLDAAGLRAALGAIGYQPREVRNEAGVEYEIVLRLRTGAAVTTRATLSKDGSLVWLVAWLRKRLRGEIDHVANVAARTEALWDFERWR